VIGFVIYWNICAGTLSISPAQVHWFICDR